MQLGKSIQEGISKVPGVESKMFQVPETLNADILAKMHAPPKPNLPIIEAQQLAEADGLMFGFPTRFGMMCAQVCHDDVFA